MNGSVFQCFGWCGRRVGGSPNASANRSHIGLSSNGDSGVKSVLHFVRAGNFSNRRRHHVRQPDRIEATENPHDQ